LNDGIYELRFSIYDFFTMQRRWKAGVVLAVVWAVVFLLGRAVFPTARQALGRYVGPVPKSVQIHLYEGNDWLGLAPECKCYFRFNIESNDFARVVTDNGFRTVRPGEGYYWPGVGPIWFTPPQSNRQYFGRYLGTGIERFPRWGQHEYLWLDQSGTNAFFMVWRMD
jgi:hypothetical protein